VTSVSDPRAVTGDGDRLLTFEVGSALYALPIAGVLEVAEVGAMACIPTLSRKVGGVVNHHGDALPVIRRSSLFEVEESELPEPTHLLVVADLPWGGAHLGLPVDRVVGLAEGRGARSRGSHLVAERRPIDGRLAGILDPQRLVERAREVIEGSLERSE
jgi:chemotaxis signal transduction protein